MSELHPDAIAMDPTDEGKKFLDTIHQARQVLAVKLYRIKRPLANQLTIHENPNRLRKIRKHVRQLLGVD